MPIAHSRDGFEETLYGLEGSDHLVFDGEQIEFRPGDTVCNRPILKRLRPSCSDTDSCRHLAPSPERPHPRSLQKDHPADHDPSSSGQTTRST
jgi:hypothetical protein